MILVCDNKTQSPFTSKAERLRRPSGAVVAYRRVGVFKNATMSNMIRDRAGRYCNPSTAHLKPGFPDTSEKRFWGFVIKTANCWLWHGRCQKPRRFNGHSILPYGLFRPTRQNWTVAHRFSWALHNGKIPDGWLVLHSCDNPKCVNPSHLFIGDSLINALDCKAKDRHPRGERHPKSKLTDEIVRAIRAEYIPYNRKHGLASMGRRYGIDSSLLCEVVKRKRWQHVA